MISRLTFLGIAGFWVTMNVLLWRSEFGARGGDTPVPATLVWRKILTAPDPSSLTFYQGGQRTGYCDFSTGVGREMAAVDADRPPPEGLAAQAGYQVHLSGNISVGEFASRIKFDGRLQFSNARDWRELDLKITARQTTVEIHSLATNQSAHFRISSDGAVIERNLAFAELQNPGALVRALSGNLAEPLLAALDVPGLSAASAARQLEWTACLTRVRIGSETVPIYRLQTGLLGRTATVDVSTLGEILRVELPGDLSARVDEWIHP